jgi:hypothetical protein
MTEAGQFAFWLAAGGFGISLLFVLKPVFAALADRIAGGRLSEDVEARLAALESRSPVTGETDAVYHRMEELEERLEFTERMLAQTRSEGLLPRGEAP